MTDPRTRKPEFWRTLAWVMTVGAFVLLVDGIVSVGPSRDR
ncbi:hypothetical protein ACFQ9V_16050 [Leifsonia sp. NPDC056665]